jgi:uncharacterized protein YlxW (UPF0749 family)
MKEELSTSKYKSPTRKLIKFFENSRNNWKDKYKEAKRQIKQLQNKTNFLKKSKEELKSEIKQLKTELSQAEVKEKQKKKEEVKKKTILKKIQKERWNYLRQNQHVIITVLIT